MEHHQMEQFYQQWAIEEQRHNESILWLKVLGFIGLALALLMVTCTLSIVLAVKDVI
jgi:hypothetical protein